MLQICIFEDQPYRNLYPLTASRPAYLLRLGIKDILGKILDHFPEAKVVLHCRKSLEAVVAEATKQTVNKLEVCDTIFVNGRILAGEIFAQHALPGSKKERMIVYNNTPLIVKINQKGLKGFRLPDVFDLKTFKNFKLTETNVEIPTVNYFWDLVQANGREINYDSRRTGLLGKHNSDVNQIKMLNPHNIFIGKDVQLKPGVVLDATDGAIFIDNHAELMPNAVVIGPAYIGFKSKLKVGAKIYGNTSIGPVCKIGGELESVIFQGYSNKQHEGFLGHSFISEWVNLGAGTENSDLKNTYHEINVLLEPDKEVKSHLQFVGCCIGDHTKTGIKTMISTGSVIGCFCNIFGPGYQPKFLPCFTWNSNLEPPVKHDPVKAIQTAKVMMSRRNLQLTKPQEKLFENIFEESAKARAALKIK